MSTTPAGKISLYDVRTALNVTNSSGGTTNYPTNTISFNDVMVRRLLTGSTSASGSGTTISLSQMRNKAGPQPYATASDAGACGIVASSTFSQNFYNGQYGTYRVDTANSNKCLPSLSMLGWYSTWYSYDAITYTQVSWPSNLILTTGTGGHPNQWMTVIYGNGKFIAATNGSFPTTTLASSTDGITWSASAGTSPISAQFTCGAYGNGVYVFLSNQGGANMITSTDGVNWTSRTLGGNMWIGMVFANGIFVAWGTSNATYARSTDGTNWTSYNIGTYNYRTATAYGNGMWIQLGSNSAGTNKYYTSTDAITWTERTLPSVKGRDGILSTNPMFNQPIYGNGKWVLWGRDCESAYSTDGINWTVSGLLPIGVWYTSVYSASLGLFIIIAQAGTPNILGTVYQGEAVITSPDGINFTARNVPGTKNLSSYNGVGLYSIAVTG